MGNFFNYNGKVYKNGDLIISADNRGLRYGDGLFETLKFQHEKLIFADAHFQRLWKGMEVLQFEIPKNFTHGFLQEEIYSLLKKNKIENSARVRLNIFRSSGGLYDPKDHLPNYIIEAMPLSEDVGKWNSNGLILGVYDEVKKSCDMLSNLKHNNYLPSVMAALQAKKEKWNDAIILNTYNRICESTIANIFIIKDEVVYTPALGEGCVAGIIRDFIINNISSLGFKSIEKEITIDELMNADEVFLTNSIYTMRWVQQIDDKKYTSHLAHKIYSSVISALL
jgi:branched-chain amino acid aminotransferase